MKLDLMTLCFIFFSFINSLFYIIWGKFIFKEKETDEIKEKVAVSILIYSKNQAEHLSKLLPKVLNQNYEEFEVIVVNHNSDESTIELIKELNHPLLKIVNVNNIEAFWGSKKYALTLGIKTAKYNQLLFLDPKVTQISNEWISSNAINFKHDNQQIINYSNFIKTKGFKALIMRFSTFFSAFLNFGMSNLSAPFKVSNENFGYTSKLFFDNNGYTTQINVKRETENLLLTQHSNTVNNTYINLNRNSTTFIEHISFKQWIIEKEQQLLSMIDNSINTKTYIGLFFCTELCFFGLSIFKLITAYNNPIVYSTIALRYSIVSFIIGKFSFKLKDVSLFYFFPVLEICNITLQIWISFTTLFRRYQK